jgi:hypothetical protein
MENTTLLLRKLSIKSTLKFGKYEKYKVEDLIQWNKKPYLVWVYYNSSNISFCDDVLEILRIYKPRRIPKPGKDKDSPWVKIIAQEFKQLMTKQDIINKTKANKKRNALLKKEVFSKFRHVESKAALQRRNQGKH